MDGCLDRSLNVVMFHQLLIVGPYRELINAELTTVTNGRFGVLTQLLIIGRNHPVSRLLNTDFIPACIFAPLTRYKCGFSWLSLLGLFFACILKTQSMRRLNGLFSGLAMDHDCPRIFLALGNHVAKAKQQVTKVFGAEVGSIS